MTELPSNRYPGCVCLPPLTPHPRPQVLIGELEEHQVCIPASPRRRPAAMLAASTDDRARGGNLVRSLHFYPHPSLAFDIARALFLHSARARVFVCVFSTLLFCVCVFLFYFFFSPALAEKTGLAGQRTPASLRGRGELPRTPVVVVVL